MDSNLVSRFYRLDVALVFLTLFIARIVGFKLYRLFFYSYFVSPLRYLPGPKVRLVAAVDLSMPI